MLAVNVSEMQGVFDAHILPTRLIYPGASGPRPHFDSPCRRNGNCCPSAARWPIVVEIEHVANVGATWTLCHIGGKTSRIERQVSAGRCPAQGTAAAVQSRGRITGSIGRRDLSDAPAKLNHRFTGVKRTVVVQIDVGARERSEEHTSELQSQSNLVCRLLLEKKKNNEIVNVQTTQLKLWTADDACTLIAA